MFKNLKQVLVESYIGAIALGWVFAEVIMGLPRLFTVTFQNWMLQQQRATSVFAGSTSGSFPTGVFLSELFRIVFLLLAGSLLLRWLYLTPAQLGYSRSSLGPRVRHVNSGSLVRERLSRERQKT